MLVGDGDGSGHCIGLLFFIGLWDRVPFTIMGFWNRVHLIYLPWNRVIFVFYVTPSCLLGMRARKKRM